jgi:hypothetical protein
MNRGVVLGALLILVVLALYGLSLAVGASSGSVDGGDRDGLGTVRSGLRSLPGLGNDLDPDELDGGGGGVSCFDVASSTFTVSGALGCRFGVPEGVDQVRLAVEAGRCRVTISEQPGTFDASTDTTRWEDGRENLSLTGDGATVELVSLDPDGSDPCRLRLNP